MRIGRPGYWEVPDQLANGHISQVPSTQLAVAAVSGDLQEDGGM